LSALALLAGCAASPVPQDVRDRLEMGLATPEDIERFQTSTQQYDALLADARTLTPLLAAAPDRQLMQAAATGDLSAMGKLLVAGAQANAVDAVGNTPLLLAAREGQVEAVRALLKAGANVDGRGGAMPPLCAAALRGHAQVVQLLLRNHADVDATGENDQSALMNAVKLNRLDVARLLLEAGANARITDRAGDNLLTVAVNDDRRQMLALLLAHGLAPDQADANGLTPLYWAQYQHRDDLAMLLRQAGADPARTKIEMLPGRPYNFGEY
jgi:ankyrin repeat protein